MALTDTEREMLVFARLSWQYEGHREQAIREKFGISRETFGMRLGRLLDRPESMEFDAFTFKRLRRLRDQRQRSRPVRRLG